MKQKKFFLQKFLVCLYFCNTVYVISALCHVTKCGLYTDPLPPLFVHVVIEWPLARKVLRKPFPEAYTSENIFCTLRWVRICLFKNSIFGIILCLNVHNTRKYDVKYLICWCIYIFLKQHWSQSCTFEMFHCTALCCDKSSFQMLKQKSSNLLTTVISFFLTFLSCEMSHVSQLI